MASVHAEPPHAMGSGPVEGRYATTEDLVEYRGVWMSKAEASARAAHDYLWPPQPRLGDK